MKKLLLMLFLAVLVTPHLAGEIPDFRLDDLNNKPVNYSDIKGEKITLIDFWATWCQPCKRAIPKLVKIYDEYKERGVEIIGVNVDGNRSLPKVKPVSRSLGINYPVVLDINAQLQAELNVSALPTLLVVDANDQIVAIHQGYRAGDEIEIRETLDNLLAGNEHTNED